MKLLTTIAILLLLSGCKAIQGLRENSEDRKIEKAVQTLKKFDVLDSLCSNEFPADTVTKTVIDTIHLPGITLTRNVRDTTYLKGDTVYHERVTEKHTTDTLIRERTITVADPKLKAELAHLKDQVKEKDKRIGELESSKTSLTIELNKSQSKNKTRTWISIASWAVILGLIAVIVAIMKGKRKLKQATKSINQLRIP